MSNNSKVEQNPKCVFLIGNICTGKSTWANAQTEYNSIASRDTIRYDFFGSDYKQNSKDEKFVTKYFNDLIDTFRFSNSSCIIDNTNLKLKYIDEIKKRLPNHCFEYKFFEAPLWKIYLRNIQRYYKQGKWIPFEVINKFQKQYKLIKDVLQY